MVNPGLPVARISDLPLGSPTGSTIIVGHNITVGISVQVRWLGDFVDGRPDVTRSFFFHVCPNGCGKDVISLLPRSFLLGKVFRLSTSSVRCSGRLTCLGGSGVVVLQLFFELGLLVSNLRFLLFLPCRDIRLLQHRNCCAPLSSYSEDAAQEDTDECIDVTWVQLDKMYRHWDEHNSGLFSDEFLIRRRATGPWAKVEQLFTEASVGLLLQFSICFHRCTSPWRGCGQGDGHAMCALTQCLLYLI